MQLEYYPAYFYIWHILAVSLSLFSLSYCSQLSQFLV